MENIADAWHRTTARRIGEAVASRRKERGLTAQQLAERCRELGAPIHRTTITKIENGRPRFDLGEFLILAAALDIPPALLLFPGYPDELPHEALPGADVDSRDAVDWLSGASPLVQLRSDKLESAPMNDGVALVHQHAEFQRALDDWRRAQTMEQGADTPELEKAAQRLIREAQARIIRLATEGSDLRAKMWHDLPALDRIIAEEILDRSADA